MLAPFASALFCFANPVNACAPSCNSFPPPPSFISVAVGQLGRSGTEVRAAHESQRQHTSCYTAYAQAAYVVMQRIELHALKTYSSECVWLFWTGASL